MDIKLLSPSAKIPTQQFEGDAGFDLYADNIDIINFEDLYWNIIVGTGVSIDLNTVEHNKETEKVCGLLFARSSIYKKPFYLANGVGLIDRDYNEEIRVIFRLPFSNVSKDFKTEIYLGHALFNSRRWENGINKGERVAQLVVVKSPLIDLKPVASFTGKAPSDNTRISGFGSSGKY